MALRSFFDIWDHSPISRSVRPHPAQIFSEGIILHIFLHGDIIRRHIGMFYSRRRRSLNQRHFWEIGLNRETNPRMFPRYPFLASKKNFLLLTKFCDPLHAHFLCDHTQDKTTLRDLFETYDSLLHTSNNDCMLYTLCGGYILSAIWIVACWETPLWVYMLWGGRKKKN